MVRVTAQKRKFSFLGEPLLTYLTTLYYSTVDLLVQQHASLNNRLTALKDNTNKQLDTMVSSLREFMQISNSNAEVMHNNMLAHMDRLEEQMGWMQQGYQSPQQSSSFNTSVHHRLLSSRSVVG